MRFLRQSTASQEILLGPFVATADGSAQTGLTIANTDIKLLKGGSTSETNKNSGGGTHIAGGRYSAVLDATDTDTVGILEVSCNPASGIPWNKSYYVLEEAVYDMLFAASALGYIANAPVNVAQFGGSNGTFASGRPEVNTTHAAGTAWNSGAIGASTLASDTITAAKIAADAITAAKVAADVTTEIQSGLATAAELAKVPKSDGTATWNATALASIQSEANDALVAYDPPTGAELVSEINAVQADIAALNNLSAATVRTQVDDALVAIHLDHLLAATYDPASKPGAADALLNELVESDAGVSRFTANALEQAPSGSGPSAADIADAVWEEAIADHSGTAGSTAEQLAAAGAAGDPWATALPGAYGAGTAGKIVGDNLNATVSSRATQTSVDDIPTNAELATALDPLPTAAENATAVWGAGTRVLTAGTNIALAKGTGVTGFNDLSAAQVNAEVDTALADYDGPTRAEATADKDEILADLATTDGKVDGVKTNTDKFANLPVLTAGGTGGQGYGAP